MALTLFVKLKIAVYGEAKAGDFGTQIFIVWSQVREGRSKYHISLNYKFSQF